MSLLGIEVARAIAAGALLNLLAGGSGTPPASRTPALLYNAAGLGDLRQNYSMFDERIVDPSPVPTPTPVAQDTFLKLVTDKLSSMATRIFGPVVGPAIIVLVSFVWLLWKSRNDLKDGGRVVRRWVMQKLGRAPPESTETLLASVPALSETDDRVGLRSLRERVKHGWIQGVLEESFSSRPRIELDKEIVPDEVERPLAATGRLTQPTPRMCPPGTTILKVFDDSGLSLLILGEPGAGKTTALLTLASGLLDRGEADPMQPVPVILNLSSWRQGRHDLFSWVAEELGRQYRFRDSWRHRG